MLKFLTKVYRIKKGKFIESKKVHLSNQKSPCTESKKSIIYLVIKLSESKKVQRSVTQFDESKKSAYRIKIDIFANYKHNKTCDYVLG